MAFHAKFIKLIDRSVIITNKLYNIQVLILFTNNREECDDFKDLKNNADYLKSKGVIIAVINVGNKTVKEENLAISSSKNLIFDAENFEDTINVFEKMIQTICNYCKN